MTTKLGLVLSALDRAMRDDYVEYGGWDIENNITVSVRPVTHDGFRTVIVNAGVFSCTVTYRANHQNTDLYVHARADVVRAIQNESNAHFMGWNVVMA